MNYGIDRNSLECANQQTSKQANKQASKQANKQASKRSQSSQYFASHREMTRRQYNNNFLFINELRNRPELFGMRFSAFVTVGKIFFGTQNSRLSYKYNYFLR